MKLNRDSLSTAERDGAILRLVYTFEAVWEAAALVLEQQEGIAVGSPKGAIRACRRANLFTDADAEDAIRIADDRNLTVRMCKQDVGESIAERLKTHAAVLRRWLEALQQSAAPR
ncbi:MAG TPA: nucleotidyltransferase substrate binding protein [Stellaceae bacterium]|nr:nucleotidyltransferase substrate binding protein [Stellaceae bacterium]